MTNLIKHLLALLLTYIMIVFVELEINPFLWDKDIRLSMIILSCLFQSGVYIFSILSNKKGGANG